MTTMRKIFTNKTLGFVIIALSVIVLLLLFILFTQLAQMASFNAKIDQLKQLIVKTDGEVQQTNELIDYLQSNEYITQWAIEKGLLPEGADSWIKK